MQMQKTPQPLPYGGRFVRLNSIVDIEEIPLGKHSTLRIVPPPDADERAGRVSTFAPLGRALLGVQVGSIVDVPLPGGASSCVHVLAVRPGGSK